MSKLPRLLVASTLSVLATLALPTPPAAAQEDIAGLCALFLFQEQTELEDLELTVQQDETRFAVAEEVFVLLDGMWQNDLIERLPYLGVKHRRDAAAIALQRTRRELDRQHAVVEQYRLACGATAPPETSAGAAQGSAGPRSENAPSVPPQGADLPRALAEAHRRYLEADCQVRALDVEVFEVDLEYHEEVLRSARDLRQGDVASVQQVLFAERDVELTMQQLEQARQRAARCGQ